MKIVGLVVVVYLVDMYIESGEEVDSWSEWLVVVALTVCMLYAAIICVCRVLRMRMGQIWVTVCGSQGGAGRTEI